MTRQPSLAAHYLTAFAMLCAFKLALFGYSASGAEGQTSAAALAAKFLLCLGWDAVGALLVTALVALVASPRAVLAWWPAGAAATVVQAVHGAYLAINHQIAMLVGAPIEKSAIDLALFNADPVPGHGAQWDLASSVRPYLTPALGATIIVAAVLPAVLPGLLRSRMATWRRGRLAAVLVLASLFVSSAVVLPRLANGALVVVHTYGLERSPIPLLAASYVRPHLRALFDEPVPEGDPFCLDLSSRVSVGSPAGNPLRFAHALRTNLVLVILESVNTSVLAHHPAPMPFLASLGTTPAGVSLNTHYSPWPQTMTAMFSLFCSELPHPDYAPITITNPAIPCVSLSEALHADGYETAFYESGDIAFDRKLRFFKHRQFDRIIDRNQMPGREGAWANSWGIDERVTVRAFLDWLATRPRDRPFFGVYYVVTGHHPYEFPGAPTLRGGTAVDEAAAQRATLGFVDDRLRELVAGMDSLGLGDDTLLAVMADHGPGSGRPGMGRVRDPSVYEGSVHVPVALHGPQLRPVEGPVTTPTSHLDVAPTLLGLLGAPVPLTMKGRDLTRTSEGQLIVMGTRPPLSQIGVRDGNWKAVLWQETGATELFDLSRDPAETQDLASAHPDIAATLATAGRTWNVHSRHLIENYAAVLRTSGHRCGPAPDPLPPAVHAAHGAPVLRLPVRSGP